MVNKYRIGYLFEKRVHRILKSILDSFGFKYKIVESRKSRGSADMLIGINTPRGLYWFGIQCKKLKPSLKEMQKAIKTALENEGMYLFFAYSLNRQIIFYPDLIKVLGEWR
jgi:hypothetical protein